MGSGDFSVWSLVQVEGDLKRKNLNFIRMAGISSFAEVDFLIGVSWLKTDRIFELSVLQSYGFDLRLSSGAHRLFTVGCVMYPYQWGYPNANTRMRSGRKRLRAPLGLQMTCRICKAPDFALIIVVLKMAIQGQHEGEVGCKREGQQTHFGGR